MVAGLTADVFVQLTATLAHLSSSINRTSTDQLAKEADFPNLQAPPSQNSGKLLICYFLLHTVTVRTETEAATTITIDETYPLGFLLAKLPLHLA